MRHLLILCLAIVFFVIGGCEKKKEGKINEKDIVAELIKENLLESTASNNVVSSEGGITEEFSNTNKQEVLSNVVEASMSSESKGSVAVDEVKIKDTGIELSEVEKRKVYKTGSYIKVGNDTSGQIVSPRKFLKLTFVVYTKSKKAKTVDFYIYAIPEGQKILNNKYLISLVRNIEVFNGQAQLTKYWNARNINWDFLPPGKYRIYMRASFKDEKGSVIESIDRYWGGKQEFYVKLY